MKKIEMVDLHTQYEHIKTEIDTAIQKVIDSTAFVKGEQIKTFEKHLEQYLGVKHAITTGNGTDALQIALMALNLKPGDEVITPAFTFVSTVEVVALLGLKPVIVDVDKDTFNISVDAIEKAITPHTKAIVPVHLFGQNADMEAILKLAKDHNLYVIEDACQAIGATYQFSNGSTAKAGCMGQIGCTSFFPSKNLGCYGDGGAIFTNDDALYEKMKMITNHGMQVRYHYDMVGVNSRLDTIQAAILDVKLQYLDSYIEHRQQAAAFYDKALIDNPNIEMPIVSSFTSHVYHQYTLKLSDKINRNELQKALKEKGIPAMIYYPIPLHLQKAYDYLGYKKGDLPVAEKLSECVLSLPMHTELVREQLNYICHNINELTN